MRIRRTDNGYQKALSHRHVMRQCKHGDTEQGYHEKETEMTRFTDNVNRYLATMKIRQTYLSMQSGIDKNKLSRILTGVQEESGSDMEKIARGLGKSVAYFLADDMVISSPGTAKADKIAFYAGEPTEKQARIARDLTELMETVDLVVSAKTRFKSIAEE